VLTFFIAGLLYLLCFEHVDNLGAYIASRPETGLLIPSDYKSLTVTTTSAFHDLFQGMKRIGSRLVLVLDLLLCGPFMVAQTGQVPAEYTFILVRAFPHDTSADFASVLFHFSASRM
jgi:hypothetical protein